MWWMCALAVAATPGWIEDRVDAIYAWETGRFDEAGSWYRTRLDETPDDPFALLDYVRTLSFAPHQRHAALPGLVEAHLREHPSVHGPAARAVALAVSSMEPTTWASGPFHDHRWCDEALAVLADHEVAGDGSDYQIARTALRMAHHCGRVTEPFEQAAGAAAMASTRSSLRAWWGRTDGFDDTDLADLKLALADTPHTMGDFTVLFTEEELAGGALEAAQAMLVDAARRGTVAERPVVVWKAIQILEAAELDDEAWTAREHLARIDPGNRANQWALERGPDAPASSDEVEASTEFDPGARRAALKAQGRPSNRHDRATWWAAWAEASHALGDDEGWLRGLRRNYDHVPYIEAALSTGKQLGPAQRWANRLVRRHRRVRVRRGRPDQVGERWRDRLADTLELQARVYDARDRRSQAHRAVSESLLLAPATAERLVLAGLTNEHHGPRTIDWLARGLGDLPEDHPRTEAAWRRLERALVAHGTWTAGSAVAFVDAMARDRAPTEAAPAPQEVPRLAGLEVFVEERRQRLLDHDGPVVVDVWATWCGPCKQSLPHFEALARAYEGRITMVALSVDEERSVAEAYLEKRGEPSFVAAWAGVPGAKALGSGIPAYLVFDAEHRLVARLAGWSPGDRRLDRAIERMLRE